MTKKERFYRALVFTFGMCLLTSCDSISVKGENGETYHSYQECCAANDYQAAHAYLAKMENADADGLKDAREYVFKQEALFLMSMDDDTAKKRLIYLLKEEGDNNDHVAMLIDLAIENDDEKFVKSLANLYSSAEKESLKKLINYLYEKNDDNKKFLTALLEKLDRKELLIETAINNNDLDFIISNIDMYDIDINRDFNIIASLASANNKSYSDVIIYLLSKVELSGAPLSKGLHGSEGKKGMMGQSKSHFSYVDDVLKYNLTCSRILDAAINNKNNYLAKKVLGAYKQNVISITGSGWISDNTAIKAPDGSGTRIDYHHSYVYYTFDDRNNAQKKYNEAVRSGAFK